MQFKLAFEQLRTYDIPADVYKSFSRYTFHHRTSLLAKYDRSKTKKLSALTSDFFKTYNINFEEKWFVNLSETEFPMEFKWILSLGKKFALPIEHERFPIFKLITDVEECIKNIDNDGEKEVTRARITNVITNKLIAGNQHTPLQKAIVRIHSDCVQFLKKNKHIIIVQADKGGATVAMLKTVYDVKMNEIFSNTNSYIELKRNPLNKLETRSNELVNRLFHIGEIDEGKKKHIITHNTQIPRVCIKIRRLPFDTSSQHQEVHRPIYLSI